MTQLLEGDKIVITSLFLIVYAVSHSNTCTADVQSSSVIVVYRKKLNTVCREEFHSHLDIYCYLPC